MATLNVTNTGLQWVATDPQTLVAVNGIRTQYSEAQMAAPPGRLSPSRAAEAGSAPSVSCLAPRRVDLGEGGKI